MAQFKIYQDRKGEFRWRLVAKNGRIIADSAEGYDTEQNVVTAVKRVMELISEATIAAEDRSNGRN